VRALIGAVLMLGAALPARAQPVAGDAALCREGAPSILVEILGLKDRMGELRVELYPDTDPEFLGDDKKLEREEKTFRRVAFAPPTMGHAFACIAAPGPGRYSLVVIHSRDNVKKFNYHHDGIAFPGDPRLFFGKPPASKAWISVARGVTRVAVRLQYYDGFLGIGPVRHPVDEGHP
jgi:uncharacterized protein (DUF2141 family)